MMLFYPCIYFFERKKGGGVVRSLTIPSRLLAVSMGQYHSVGVNDFWGVDRGFFNAQFHTKCAVLEEFVQF